MSRTTLDTAALAHDLRLAVMRFSRRLRNQRVDTSVTLTHLAALSTLKRPHPTDGRQVIIGLTSAADELLSAEARAREAWLSERLQELPAEEREVLREAAVIIDKLASG